MKRIVCLFLKFTPTSSPLPPIKPSRKHAKLIPWGILLCDTPNSGKIFTEQDSTKFTKIFSLFFIENFKSQNKLGKKKIQLNLYKFSFSRRNNIKLNRYTPSPKRQFFNHKEQKDK